MVEEDAETTAARMSSRGVGAVDNAIRGGGGADNAKRYGGRRRRVGSSPAACATPTDAAMPLSPPTDDGNDHDDEGEGRRDMTRGGGGDDKGREQSVDGARRESGEQ